VYTASGEALRAPRRGDAAAQHPAQARHRAAAVARAGAIEAGKRVAREVADALGVKPGGRTAQACTAQ
jgi:hypothetical protein